MKLVVYFIFLLTFYIDLESMHRVDEEGRRVKDTLYWIRKVICSLI